jgi:hypothetical protein
MRTKKAQTLDTVELPAPITLTDRQRSDLIAAIPFRRVGAQEELIPVVGQEPSEPSPSETTLLKRKGKWRSDHDVTRVEGTFDTDIMIAGPLYKKSLGSGSL